MSAPVPAPGHVFVAHGDVTNIACDAWLLPTNRNLKVEDFWKFDAARIPEKPERWGDNGVRVVKAKVCSLMCRRLVAVRLRDLYLLMLLRVHPASKAMRPIS